MPIKSHPALGTVLLCDFNTGFMPPEMVKRRPVVVISPRITARPGLATVVALSTTPPNEVMPYHCQIDIIPELPAPWSSESNWVKGDMVYSISLQRLDFFRIGKDKQGKRIYLTQPLSNENIKKIRACVLSGIGLAALTKHL
jgi:mRNA interferase MazF